MGVAYECSCMKYAFKEREFVKEFWESCFEDITAYYAIIKKNTKEFLGYCAIIDLTALYWEVAIELFENIDTMVMGMRPFLLCLINCMF